jgi:hypothetical protein
MYSSRIVFLEILVKRLNKKIPTCQTITLHIQQKQHGFPLLFHMIHRHRKYMMSATIRSMYEMHIAKKRLHYASSSSDGVSECMQPAFQIMHLHTQRMQAERASAAWEYFNLDVHC